MPAPPTIAPPAAPAAPPVPPAAPLAPPALDPPVLEPPVPEPPVPEPPVPEPPAPDPPVAEPPGPEPPVPDPPVPEPPVPEPPVPEPPVPEPPAPYPPVPDPPVLDPPVLDPPAPDAPAPDPLAPPLPPLPLPMPPLPIPPEPVPMVPPGPPSESGVYPIRPHAVARAPEESPTRRAERMLPVALGSSDPETSGLWQATRWTCLGNERALPGANDGEMKTMENAGVQKKQTGESPSVVRALWDPFGFMQQMFGWGRSGDQPLFEVKETDDTFVCKVRVNLTLPDQADVAHAKAELENGELTLVVPKAAAETLNAESPQATSSGQEPESPPQATSSGQEPESPPQATSSGQEPESPPQTASATPDQASAPRRARRRKGAGNGSSSAARGPRRGGRTQARRGR